MSPEQGSYNERRIAWLENRLDAQESRYELRISALERQVAGLLSWQKDLRARHASQPAWVGVVVSLITGAGAVMVTLYLSG